MFNFRTDMADEKFYACTKINNFNNIDGIKTEEQNDDKNIKSFIVNITNKNGEKLIGKPIGTYITIDLKDFKNADINFINQASSIFCEKLKKIVDSKIQKQDEILVVGLGNRFVTPDALGSKVSQEIEVTRHLLKYTPQYVTKGTRSVATIAPGVLGTTGIETVEIIKGIVDNIKPKMIIAIDSLASKNISRISSSIQISDTGIIPGSGVGNTRKELSQNNLGIPVIAIGVPMVVDFATIAYDCFNIFNTYNNEKNYLKEKSKLNNFSTSKSIYNYTIQNSFLNNFENFNYEKIQKILNPLDYNMIVTPCDIDDLIENMKDVISNGINMAI